MMTLKNTVYVLRNVCSVGLNRMIEAWNNHSIPQKGIPNTLQANNDGTNPINPADIPTASAAVSQYRQQGGSLTLLNLGMIPLQMMHNYADVEKTCGY